MPGIRRPATGAGLPVTGAAMKRGGRDRVPRTWRLFSGLAVDRDDVRSHGRDERIRTGDYYDGVGVWYRWLKSLTVKIVDASAVTNEGTL